MARNYVMMRQILAASIGHRREDGVSVFYDLGDASAVERELTRLACDGLLDVDMGPNCFGETVARFWSPDILTGNRTRERGFRMSSASLAKRPKPSICCKSNPFRA